MQRGGQERFDWERLGIGEIGEIGEIGYIGLIRWVGEGFMFLMKNVK